MQVISSLPGDIRCRPGQQRPPAPACTVTKVAFAHRSRGVDAHRTDDQRDVDIALKL